MTARPPLDPAWDWRMDAACRGTVPTELFFIERGKSVPPEVAAVCERCPMAVRHACLEDALQRDEPGYRAGTSERERRKIRQRRRRTGLGGEAA